MNEQIHVNQRTQDLLNGGIDGELSTLEQQELDELLAGSDTVREFNEELKELTSLLDDVPEREPPQYLQSAIERQISLPMPSNRHEEQQGFFGTWLPAHWLHTGFALAAGAVLTIGVYEMGSEPITAEDAASLVGTIVDNPALDNPALDQGVLLDSIHIFTDTLNGQVELRNKNDLFTLDVQLSSDGPTQVTVNFAGRGLEFEEIVHNQDRKDAVSIADGSINVASSGEQHYELKLRRTVEEQGQEIAPLKLEFFSNNTLVHKAELNVSQHKQN